MHLWGAWASTSKIWGFMRGFAKENSFGLGKMGGGGIDFPQLRTMGKTGYFAYNYYLVENRHLA